MSSDTGALRGLESLVSPFGVVSRVRPRSGPPGLGIDLFSASIGDPEPHHAGVEARRAIAGSAKGRGEAERTRLIALAEAAERFAGGVHRDEITSHKTATELDGRVIDLSTIARCSATELADPSCPLRPFDPGAPMRWIQGTDVHTLEPVWLPAVMACYRLTNLSPAERFWYRISTGYAVHTDPVESLVRSICEVVERDMIALTWLQRLPLTPIPNHCRSGELDTLLSWSSDHFLTTYLLDATSDIAAPTVYCLQISEHDETVRQYVGCATGRSLARAAVAALTDTLIARWLGHGRGEVKDPRRFTSIVDGAAYMGRPEMAAAFDFLVDGASLPPAPHRPGLPEDPAEALAVLVESLAAAGMQAVALDRTAPELAAVGLTATTVVVPKLMPMSLSPLAQYRAHPRLFEAPALMGYRTLAEEELNPWPQPFA